jgi:hypothetical protein
MLDLLSFTNVDPQALGSNLLARRRNHLLVVMKCIYLPPTYLHFIQDIEDRFLLLTSSMSFVDLAF